MPSPAEVLIAEIKSLTKAQRETLDRLSMSMPAGASRRTLQSLERRWLIVGSMCVSIDGRFRWIEYHVPIAVHMAWCAVCLEEWHALSDEEKAQMEAGDCASTCACCGNPVTQRSIGAFFSTCPFCATSESRT